MKRVSGSRRGGRKEHQKGIPELMRPGVADGLGGASPRDRRGAPSADKVQDLARPAARRAVRRRVMMLGLRGIPNVQGGVEKHVEMLASRLLVHGWDVEVVGRRRYLPGQAPSQWNGIRIFPLWAPRLMALEAFVHTFLGVCLAAVRRPDILHIHAVGPALFVPLARMLGIRVVVTHHGYDYDRQKWGRFAKTMLKFGEFVGMRLSHGRIAISKDIVETIGARHHVPMSLVPNGVAVPASDGETGILAQFALRPRQYVLLAARFVPEKRQTDLIAAFARCGRSDLRLVLVGDAEFETPYVQQVRALAEKTPGVALTGFRTGAELAELFANAALFVLPSSHEGMPIALLEAMAYGLPVLASDIVANRELDLPADEYFPLGDIDALAAAIAAKIGNPPTDAEIRARIEHVEKAFSWASVAQKTVSVYSTLPSR